MARPYLAIQHGGETLVLCDHDGSVTAFDLLDPSFPAPRKRPEIASALRWGARVSGSTDEFAERHIPLVCSGDTEADAEDVYVLLSRAVQSYRPRLLWRSSSGSALISTTIRVAELVETSVKKLRRAQGRIPVILTLTTDESWLGEGVPFAPTPAALPAEFAVEVTKGDRSAPVRMKATSASANEMLGLGIKHDPGDLFDAIDAIATPSAETLTSTFAALATAPDIDTDDNRGAHVPFVKVATSAAAAASTRLRAVAKVTGSGVATTAEAEHGSTEALDTSTHWLPLPGVVNIPAGGVPSIEADSGYADAANLVNQTADDSVVDLSSIPYDGQSFQLAAPARLDPATFKVTLASASGADWLSLRVYEYDTATKTLGAVVEFTEKKYIANQSATADTFPAWSYGAELPAGDYYILAEHWYGTGTFSLSYQDATNPYTDGYRGTSTAKTLGSTVTEQSGDDLYMVLPVKYRLGFDSELTIHAKCSESSKTGTLHSSVRLPADDFATCIAHSFGAGEGILIEAADPLAAPATYVTTSSDGTAGPVLSPSVWHGSPRLRPGDSSIIFAGDGTGTISGTYYPCYSNASAGNL